MNYVKKAKEFVILLIDSETSTEQVKCLIGTASLTQLNAISEILYNLLHGDIKLNRDIAIKVKRHKKILQEICDQENSFSSRLSLIRKHIKLAASILSGSALEVRKIIKQDGK